VEPKPGWSSAKISTPAFDEPTLLWHRLEESLLAEVTGQGEYEAEASSALVRPSFGVPE
jgi:hypothetical protein